MWVIFFNKTETSLMDQNKKQIQKHKPTTCPCTFHIRESFTQLYSKQAIKQTAKMKLTETKHKTKKQKSKRSLGETRYDDSSSHVRKQNGPSNQQGDPMVKLSSLFPDMK
ncbi:hypothetical protein ERO13_A13G149501v2 [Gossypium hirsutum]|uniref:Uncharacterized protein n=1 Tax=Gossypium mustelinum TaxID=34275 RepID=A0A5D2WJH3_GOSMU|nr:hypothetical protein ERO13_A13G149501v2 [Gossypium hirsutum]TYJ01687.1 hypothetical protein E1A91_A13G171900v1 [Gossypium mustelinum]